MSEQKPNTIKHKRMHSMEEYAPNKKLNFDLVLRPAQGAAAPIVPALVKPVPDYIAYAETPRWSAVDKKKTPKNASMTTVEEGEACFKFEAVEEVYIKQEVLDMDEAPLNAVPLSAALNTSYVDTSYTRVRDRSYLTASKQKEDDRRITKEHIGHVGFSALDIVDPELNAGIATGFNEQDEADLALIPQRASARP